jgi:protein-tyrosine phosphatase
MADRRAHYGMLVGDGVPPVIDLHTHVLCAIDDGPADMAGSLALLRAAAAEGIEAVVATPHVSERYPTSAARMAEGVAAVGAAAREEGIAVDVLCGAEIALDRCLALDDDELHALRLGDGPYLLVEAPLSPAAGDADPIVQTLLERGLRLVLAHPERCPAFQREPERLAAHVAAGVLCSVTSGALTGGFGEPARRAAVTMLGAGLVHNVTSDAHDAHRRPPDLRSALQRASATTPGLAERAGWLTQDVPAAIVAGRRPPPPPPATTGVMAVPRRSWLRRALGERR